MTSSHLGAGAGKDAGKDAEEQEQDEDAHPQDVSRLTAASTNFKDEATAQAEEPAVSDPHSPVTDNTPTRGIHLRGRDLNLGGQPPTCRRRNEMGLSLITYFYQ